MRLISNEELIVVSGGGDGCLWCRVVDAIGSIFTDTATEEPVDQRVVITAERWTDAQKAAYDALEICRAYAADGLGGVQITQGRPNTVGTVNAEIEGGGAKVGGSLTINGTTVSVQSSCPAP
jgi:hypothetical protein